MPEIKVYGLVDCADTRRAREHLDLLGVPYDVIDVGSNSEAAAWVRQQNGGRLWTPTIRVGGRVLSVPSDAELERALRRAHVMS
jgi:mycoredoxin